MSRTVQLLATRDACIALLGDDVVVPDAPLVRAGFPVDPERCRTPLGRWLAGRIGSTRRDTPASACFMDLSALEGERRRAAQRQMGWAANFLSGLYEWPVLGERRTFFAVSAEDYFDICAGVLGSTGGMLRWAGALREPLPESIAQAAGLVPAPPERASAAR